MTSSISSVSQTLPVVAPAAGQVAAANKASKSTPVSSTVVSISVAGQTALKEATETVAQTTQEARSGDHQAQRMMAKSAAKAS